MTLARKMDVACVAIGSQNPVKIEAVVKAVRQVWPNVDCRGCQVTSGISEQPLGEDEAIRGAINRAIGSCQKLKADLGVGLEGYIVESSHGMFLSAWVAIVHKDDPGLNTAPVDIGALQVGLGSGGRILLPDTVAEQVRQGYELGPLMDMLTGQENIKHKQGAVGILTAGLLSRQEALTQGVLYALARFVSPMRY